LLEGILFGTTKGAFTGAIERPGIFEQANGGTLLLDEINSMPIGLQTKLLRAVQENKIRRVGALEEIPFDLKIISSSNMVPYQAVDSGHLRQDLFYRLGVVFIRIPNLRDRLDDLGLLTSHFVEKLNAYLGTNIPGFRAEVLERFKTHHWPGNVRELAHVIEGSMNMVQGNEPIGLQQVSFHLTDELHKSKTALDPTKDSSGAAIAGWWEPAKTAVSGKQGSFPKQGLTSLQAEREERIIRQALTATAGNVSMAAGKLELSPQLLNFKMKNWASSVLLIDTEARVFD